MLVAGYFIYSPIIILLVLFKGAKFVITKILESYSNETKSEAKPMITRHKYLVIDQFQMIKEELINQETYIE
jgi:hypothetical protein